MPDYNTVGVLPGTRLLRIVRVEHGWQLWLATRDFIYGTYLMVMDDGSVFRVTERIGEGPETIHVRPRDEDIK